MDIDFITMGAKEARKTYNDYRKAVRERYGSLAAASTADATMVRAYRELAQGRQLLDITKVMQTVGQDLEGRPILAICRADAHWCRCWRSMQGELVFRKEDDSSIGWWAMRVRKTRGDVGCPVGTLPEHKELVRGRAMVPEIPIYLRPHDDLSKYHILWEATWVPLPPADPILLKRLGSGLFVVLAQWDLTPIEQAVLRGLRT